MSARQFASREIEGGAPSEFRHRSADWLCDEAFRLVDLAGTYVDDGAFKTAADRLRQAADKLDLAVKARNRELGLPELGA